MPHFQASCTPVRAISQAQPGGWTCADQPCVLAVVTVAPTPRASGTVPQGLLSTSTPYIIHPHGPQAWAKSGPSRGSQWPPTAQFSAGHRSITQVPSIVTHGPPAPTVPHLQPACTSMGARDQAQPLLVGGSGRQCRGPGGLGLLGWPGVLLPQTVLGGPSWAGDACHRGLLRAGTRVPRQPWPGVPIQE